MKLPAMFHVKPRAEKRVATADELELLRFYAEVAKPDHARRLEEKHRRAVEDSGEIARL